MARQWVEEGRTGGGIGMKDGGEKFGESRKHSSRDGEKNMFPLCSKGQNGGIHQNPLMKGNSS